MDGEKFDEISVTFEVIIGEMVPYTVDYYPSVELVLAEAVYMKSVEVELFGLHAEVHHSPNVYVAFEYLIAVLSDGRIGFDAEILLAVDVGWVGHYLHTIQIG